MSTTLRPWRVITTRNDDTLECSVAEVESFGAYVMALYAYRNKLQRLQAGDAPFNNIELRDPLDICVLDTHYQAPSNLQPANDGLDAPGLYLWHDQAERYHRLP